MRTNSLDLVTHDSLEMGTSYVQDVQPPWRLSPFLGWNSRAKKADQGPHGSFTAGSVEVPTATDVETPPLIKAGSSLCLLSFKCVHHWALSARRVFVILFCSLYIKENALPYFPWFWEINAFHGNFITSVFIEVNHSSLSLPPEDVSVDPWIVLSPSINRAGITLHVLPVVNVGAGPGPTPTWQAWPQWEHISVDSALLSSSLLCSEYFWSKSCVYRGVGGDWTLKRSIILPIPSSPIHVNWSPGMVTATTPAVSLPFNVVPPSHPNTAHDWAVKHRLTPHSVLLLPPSWRHPEDTRSRCCPGKRSLETSAHVSGPWTLYELWEMFVELPSPVGITPRAPRATVGP